MLFIFGFRTTVATLGMLTLACRNGHTAAHRLVKVTRKFTLFFVPLFPISRKYRTVCAHCGLQVAWSKEDAEGAVNAANSVTAGGPAPVDPVSAPIHPYPAPAVAAVVPAGWYPDPSSPDKLRYWDGQGWTAAEHNPAEG